MGRFSSPDVDGHATDDGRKRREALLSVEQKPGGAVWIHLLAATSPRFQ